VNLWENWVLKKTVEKKSV